MCTLVITLATCGRMSTLLSAATVPVASSITSTSRCCTTTVVTLTGAPPLPDAADAGTAPAAAACVPADGLPRINA